MGGCQNYGPFWGTLNIRCRIIIGIKKGTIILTTNHIEGLGFIGYKPYVSLASVYLAPMYRDQSERLSK